MTERKIIASRDGIALAEPADGDREWLAERGDRAFDVDPDERPMPIRFPITRAVVVDQASGELLGEVSWHPVSYGPSVGCLAWNFGRVLLPSARGRGIGSTVLRLIVDHLFATTEVDRIEGSTDVENVAAQRSLERVGFRREGVIRGAQLRGGRRRDMVLYGLLRTDPRS